MRAWIPDPLRNERGATIVLVTLMLAALLGMAALAIDVGMLYNARAEAQRAADAAALAGAGSLLVAPDEERARSIAIDFGVENDVQGLPVQLLDEDVAVDLNAMTVRATVRRAASRGNAMATWFARIFGVDEVDVEARATAAVGSTNTATCLKPWVVPDAWDDIDLDDQFDPAVDYYEPGVTSYGSEYRNGVPASNGIDPPGTTYIADFGRPILLKSGDPKKAPHPGWYYPWDVPQPDGAPAVGGDRYRWNIANCNPSIVTLGERYMIENGNMIGPTRQGMDDLIAKDPNAYWDTAGDSVAMSAAPSWEGSPRIVYIPLYDPREEIAPGKKPVTLTNVTAFFVEEMRGNDVFGRFLYASGVPGGVEVTGGVALKYVHLVE
jgi:Flp pilus assembly protein TadG